MTKEQAKELSARHHRAAYAARAFATSTPGTLTHKRRETTWDKAEKRFADYLDEHTDK